MEHLLQLHELHANIGPFHILQGVSFTVNTAQATALMGRNGAGKTTTIRSIMGQTDRMAGSIQFNGKDITRDEPFKIARFGIGYVPEDQSIFSNLTVEENIRVAIRGKESDAKDRLSFIMDLFPDLKAAWKRKGGLLSGGQKQMLAIARAYVSPNELLLIDEPSKGLAPVMVEKLADSLLELKKWTTILLVEQNLWLASHVSDQYIVMDEGRTISTGDMEQLKQDTMLQETMLGIRM